VEGRVKKRLQSIHWNRYTVQSSLKELDAYSSILEME
jgi:hypothetical protein